ncbi:MAG: hypothetical protein HWE16_12080 [Gammaproteobacteria bacterium]|nr:hypothetical protein [Gammaproteobacteria bacterium]
MQNLWLNKTIYLSLFLFLLGVGSTAICADKKTNIQNVAQQDIISDFEELYRRLQKAHYNLYVNRSKQEFDKHFLTLKESIDHDMTISQATLLFQELASFANIAHTKIDLPTQDYMNFRKAGGKAFPLFIKVIDDKVYVAENYSNQSNIKIGDEVVGLNKHSIKKVLNDLRRFKSADNDRMFYGFLEFEFPMLLWFEFGELDSYDIQIKGKDGNKRVTVSTIGYEDLIEKMEQRKGLLELGFERIAKVSDQIGYLRPGPFFNTEPNATNVWDNVSFKRFIDDSFKKFVDEKAKAILIDMRNNPGGDNSFSDYMLKKFANKDFKFASSFKVKVSSEFIDANEKRLKNSSDMSYKYQQAYKDLSEGDIFEFNLPLNQAEQNILKKPVYMLINRHSYSNAVTTAALAQDYGFATIMGEETNDLATTYGAMEAFELSKTGIAVSFPKAHIIRPNGEVNAHGVMPDLIIKTPLVEYAEDTVLQEALKEIEARL